MFKDVVQLCSSIPRLKILKFVLLDPQMRATAGTISATIGIQKNAVMQELQMLKRQGIVISRRQGKNIFWSGNVGHPLAPALRTFLEEVTIPDDTVIAKAFRGIPGIILVIAAGLLAREERGEIDILIVTRKPKDIRIAQAVRKIESLAALPLRYAVLEGKEYVERLEARDRLLRDVLEFSHRIILGRRN
jgi:DNA-binding transcriptional ArsR family regulator